MAARHEEGCYDEKKSRTIFFLCAMPVWSNHDSEGARGTVFHEIRPGADFQTGGFVRDKLGGATVERPLHRGRRYSATRKS